MRSLKLLKYVIMLVGLALLFGGAYHIVQQRAFLASAVEAEGVAVMVRYETSDEGGRTVMTVRFVTPEERTVEFTASSPGTPDFAYGQKVPVKYDPADPGNAKVGSRWALWGGPVMAVTIGALVSLVFAVMFARGFSRARDLRDLKRRGVPVRTRFVSSQPDLHNAVGVVRAYRITSEGLDRGTGRKREFTSEPLWLNLDGYVPDRDITVYVDRKDPKVYHMDLAFLPEKDLRYGSGRNKSEPRDFALIGFSSPKVYFAPIWCWPVVAYLALDPERFGLTPAWLDWNFVAGTYVTCLAWLIFGCFKRRVQWDEAFFMGLWLPFFGVFVLVVLAMMIEMAVHA